MVRWAQAAHYTANGHARPGGQLAVQVPAHGHHEAGHILAELAAEHPYREAMEPYPHTSGTCTPDFYATQLYLLGFQTRHVRMQVYEHVLPGPRAMVEWFTGSALTRYRAHMSSDMYATFVREYEDRVVAFCGEPRPYYLPFNRILVWGRLPVSSEHDE